MKIEKFEDIEAWKEGRKLANQVYETCSIGSFAKDFSLKDQIQRASVSVMANIAEGFDAGTDKEFIRFLVIARRSATEVQSHLYVALDRKHVDAQKFQDLYKQTVAVKNLVYGFIRYLKSKTTSHIGHRTSDIGHRT